MPSGYCVGTGGEGRKTGRRLRVDDRVQLRVTGELMVAYPERRDEAAGRCSKDGKQERSEN